MPQSYPSPHRPRLAQGYTLVELLTVIAIIAVLAGILLPTVGIVMRKSREARTRVLLGHITDAFESYKTQYGRYPIFTELGAQKIIWKTNPNESDYTFLLNDNDNLLRKVLSSDKEYQDSVSSPGATNYNPQKIDFLTLTDEALSSNPPVGSNDNPAIVDAFGDTDIGVVVHVGNNREIDKDSFVKGVKDADGNGPLEPKVVRNIPTTIALYTLEEDDNDDSINSLWLTTWDYKNFNQ
ncbi:MAG TPA: prepilin-type N-terminal cleavage/methylation domain-containing protein [Opitutales bacterium]|jgi:prepilin-type N-terminal cleavage/methylation domain-containing protein|nr:prepilin-type N-terminal cleavage/methylation domain-containing protein [Opitutales bacterium]